MSIRMLKFKVTPYGTFESGQVVAGLPAHMEYQLMESGDAASVEVKDFAAEIVGAGGGTGLAQTIILFGTSIEALNNINNGLAMPNLVLNENRLADRGYFTWANILLGGAFRVVRNAGVPGNKTEQMLDRLKNDVLVYPSGYVLVGGPTNDYSTESFETITTNLKAIYDRIVQSGRGLIATTSLVNTTVAASESLRALQSKVHAWQASYVQTNVGSILLDVHTPLVDPTSATGAPFSGALTDSAHPSVYGAQLIAKSIAAQLNGRFLKYRFAATRGDVVTLSHEFGNLIENPIMFGTGGANLDNVAGDVAPTVTGTPPADWQLWYAGGASTVSVQITHTKPSRTDLPNLTYWQTVVVFPSQAAQVTLWYTSDSSFVIPASIVAGDVIDFAAEIDLSDVTNLGGMEFRVRFRNDAGTELGTFGLEYNESVNKGPVAFSGVLRASGIYPSGATRAQVFVAMRSIAGAAGGYTLKIGNIELRKRQASN